VGRFLSNYFDLLFYVIFSSSQRALRNKRSAAEVAYSHFRLSV